MICIVSTAIRRPGILLGHAISGVLLAVAGTVGLTVLVLHPRFTDHSGDTAQLVSTLAFTWIGGLILFKGGVPAVGWLLCIIGLFNIGLALDEPMRWGVLDRGGFVYFSIILLTGLLFLVFPTGRPPSRRWWWVLWLAAAVESFNLVTAIFDPGDPVPCSVHGSFACLAVEGLVFGSVVGILLASVGALVVRYRRSSGVEKLQVKWFVAAVVSMVIVVAIGEVLGGADPSRELLWNLLLALALLALPVSIGLSIMRFRLFDIDRIVSRTVTYALTIVLLGGVYAMIAYLPGLLVIGVGGSSPPLLVAGSTLAAAAAFNPLRRRIRRLVDRRFNRSHYDAESVIEEFTGSLQHQVDLDAVLAGWIGVVTVTMEPTTVGVWMKG